MTVQSHGRMKDRDTRVLLHACGIEPMLARKIGKKFFSKLQSNPCCVCGNVLVVMVMVKSLLLSHGYGVEQWPVGPHLVEKIL